jgi:MFS family permease
MIFGLGGAFGPVLAGQLVQHWGWEAVFWFRAPIAALAFALAWVLPRGERHEHARFDAPGAVLMVAAVTGLLFTLNRFQYLGQMVWPMVLSGLLTVAAGVGFVLRERRTAQPLIDLRYFHDRDFALVNAAHVALNVAGFSIMLLVPFYLDRVVGLSVPLIGVTLAAGPAGVMIAGPVAGRVATWIAPRRLALCGAALLAIAQFGIGSVGAHPVMLLLVAMMVTHGFGLGLFQVAYFDIATATIPRQDRGVAGSLVMMTRTIGVVTGATMLMLLFQSLRGTAADMPETEAFLYGFRGAFWITAALPVTAVLAGLLSGWARPQPPMSRLQP